MFWLKYTISRIKCLLVTLIAEWTLQNIDKGSVKADLQRLFELKESRIRYQEKKLRTDINNFSDDIKKSNI